MTIRLAGNPFHKSSTLRRLFIAARAGESILTCGRASFIQIGSALRRIYMRFL
jgi:hypothetical protein